ncbi:MAG: hypothetical protein LBT47_10845 [Deltaproteobacteria bacterium]|jgi:hypothetical protein|nr:hypothetical protein [Deltaproteobacteria bacterium]
MKILILADKTKGVSLLHLGARASGSGLYLNLLRPAESMNQDLEQALKALRTDGDLRSFAAAIKNLTLIGLALGPETGPFQDLTLAKVQGHHRGREVVFLAVFGAGPAAEVFIEKQRAQIPVEGEVRVLSVPAVKLLSYATTKGLGVWFEPDPEGGEGGRFLTSTETARLLENAGPSPGPMVRVPIRDLDLSRSRTLKELCELFFDENPAELGIRLGRLVATGVVEGSASPSEPDEILYEPLAAFYLGFGGSSERAREFREWFKTLITTAFFEQDNLAGEIMALSKENRELKKNLDFSENFKQKVKREYQKLKTRFEEAQLAAAGAAQINQNELEKERDLRQKEGRTLSRLHREIVRLESDLLASEEWPYPLSLAEISLAAEKLYSSKLIIVNGPNRVELSDAAMDRNRQLVAEAVGMFRALALHLHPMRFKYGSYDPERFTRITGLNLTVPVGRDYASSTVCTRRVEWRGQYVVCNNYIQCKSDDYRLLLHFQTLDEERKFLVSHLTVFAVSGLFKLVPGQD